MSFVGPRPERKYFVDKIMERDSRYKYLYQVRPGLTSEATVYNGYTNTMEKMLKRLSMDLDYMQRRSLWSDFKIVCLTVFAVCLKK
jgi:lipopolysaccharide/colanic/teichoic acid biosynthesis glycosyltransferase